MAWFQCLTGPNLELLSRLAPHCQDGSQAGALASLLLVFLKPTRGPGIPAPVQARTLALLAGLAPALPPGTALALSRYSHQAQVRHYQWRV